MQDSMSYWLHAPRTFCLCPTDLTDPGQHVLLTSQTQELCPIGHWSHRCRICCVYPIDLIDPGHFMFYWPHSPRAVHPIDIIRPRNYVPLITQMQDSMSYWPHTPRTFCLCSTDLTDPEQYTYPTDFKDQGILSHWPHRPRTFSLCPADLTDPGHFVYVLLTSQIQGSMSYWLQRSRNYVPLISQMQDSMSYWPHRPRTFSPTTAFVVVEK